MELLSQGQMTGLCAETYSPFLSTFYFLECKGIVLFERAGTYNGQIKFAYEHCRVGLRGLSCGNVRVLHERMDFKVICQVFCFAICGECVNFVSCSDLK